MQTGDDRIVGQSSDTTNLGPTGMWPLEGECVGEPLRAQVCGRNAHPVKVSRHCQPEGLAPPAAVDMENQFAPVSIRRVAWKQARWDRNPGLSNFVAPLV